jgi:hypothetical protein
MVNAQTKFAARLQHVIICNILVGTSRANELYLHRMRLFVDTLHAARGQEEIDNEGNIGPFKSGTLRKVQNAPL